MVPKPRPVGACLAGDQAHPWACGSLPCRRSGAPLGLWEPALQAIRRFGASFAGKARSHREPWFQNRGLWEPALQAIEQQGTSFAGKARSHRKTLPFARKPAPTGSHGSRPKACGSLPCRRSGAPFGLWEPALQAIRRFGTSFAGKARSHRKTLPFARKPAPTGKPSGPVRRASAPARAAPHPPRSAGARSRARWRRSSSTALRRGRAGRSRRRRPRHRRP